MSRNASKDKVLRAVETMIAVLEVVVFILPLYGAKKNACNKKGTGKG